MHWDLITIIAIFLAIAAGREAELILAKARASHWNGFKLR